MKKRIECTSLIVAMALAVMPASADAAKLLAYYDFNDASDPAVAPDLSGNAPNASLRGPAVFTADAGGFSAAAGDRALDLVEAGNSAYAVTPVGGHLQLANLAGAMSVSWWQNNPGNGAGGFAATSSFWMTAPSASGGERWRARFPGSCSVE